VREKLNVLGILIAISFSLFSFQTFSMEDEFEILDDQYDLSLEKKVKIVPKKKKIKKIRKLKIVNAVKKVPTKSLEDKVIADIEEVRVENKAADSDIKKFIKKHNVKLKDEEIRTIENAPALGAADISPSSNSTGDSLEDAINDTVKTLGGLKIDKEDKKAKADATNPKSAKNGSSAKSSSGFLGEQTLNHMIDQMGKNNPFAKMNKKDISDLVDSKFNFPKAKEVLKICPKCKTFFVDLLSDKEAIPSFLGIIKKKEELKMYGAAVAGLFVLCILINLFAFRKLNFIFKIIARMFVMFVGFLGNFALFYVFFEPEISPGLKIFTKTFL
jgi:hypothetical protein